MDGFRTRSILCMPIRDAQRQVIGVAQFVNKLDGTAFTSNDENIFEVSRQPTSILTFITLTAIALSPQTRPVKTNRIGLCIAAFDGVSDRPRPCCSCYRQHRAQRKSAGISFTQRPILRFFAPQGRHVAPMGVKFGMEDGSEGHLLHATFHPHRCNDKGVGPPKLKFLLRFD